MLPKMGWVAKDNITTARAYLIGGGVLLILIALVVPFAAMTTWVKFIRFPFHNSYKGESQWSRITKVGWKR